MKKTLAMILAVVFLVVCCVACSANTDETTGTTTTEPVTEVVTDENGETVTEVVTDASGETVTEVVTEQVTTEDGTIETVTKTVPVTQAVTQQSTTKRTTTTTKKNTSSGGSSGSTSKETTTKKSTTTAKPTTTKPTTTAHTHNWVAQTKTETTYKWENHAFCGGCDMDMTEEAHKLGMSPSVFHVKHYNGIGVTPCPKTNGNISEGYYEQVKVATGTTTVVTGYKCSTCGATKDA